MDTWIWILLGIAILMIVIASIGFAVTSEGAWRWILIIIGILLLIVSIALAVISSSNKRFTEFASSPQGQQLIKLALV